MTPASPGLSQSLENTLTSFVKNEEQTLVAIIQDLIRLPSENTPPHGAEDACQQYIAGFLKKLSLEPDLYSPDDIAGIREHPLYFYGRNYGNRRNVNARLGGSGDGRSLILSGHIDTVPKGTQTWTRDPLGGQREGNLLFGRGSNDMKAGVATNLFTCYALSKLGVSLTGDLIFESVVDEEFGGSNGTLAGRLRGFNADAAIISEPTFLRICPAQRGGRVAHIVLEAPGGGVLTEGAFPTGIADPLQYFLAKVKEFSAQRRKHVRANELYRSHTDPVPVSVTKIVTSPWGPREPIAIPEQCQIEMYWQTMPGESQCEIEEEFLTWLDSMTQQSNGLLRKRPSFTFPLRWLPGSAVSVEEPAVRELAACAKSVLGAPPVIAGIEGPCDLYIFQQGFQTPAVLWGARGGNTHAADEYVEIDSVVTAAKALLLFVCHWCGIYEA